MNDEDKFLVSLACTKRGCDGIVELPDDQEIYDGERGHCITCGRIHVAVEYPDSMKLEFDERETRKWRRDVKSTALSKLSKDSQ